MLYGATQDGRVMVERSDRMWFTGEGNGKPLQCSCLENAMNSAYISIITLNENRLISTIKRHRIAYWIKKQYPVINYLQEIHFSLKDTLRLNMKVWEIRYSIQIENKRKQGYLYVQQDKTGFTSKTVTREKEGHYIMIK